jgi:phosphatidylethanolamine-binding protein (PEBP) family uncharacterized protein
VGRGIRSAALCCAVTALAATGCGSSSKKDTNTTSSAGGVVQQPKPVEPISAAVAPLNKAIKDQSCAEFAAIDFSGGRQNTTPGAPPVGSECKFMNRALKTSKDLKFTHGAEYGTAALIEGPAPPALAKKVPGKAVSLALYLLDRDGKYRFLFSHIDVQQIGTKPNAGADDGGKNAQAVVDAIRAGDCKKLVPLIHPQGSLAHSFGGNVKAGCKALVGGKIFAPSVKETPNAKADLLGGTRDYQFYGVATKKTYFTLIMATPPGTSSKPPLLFEELPNTDNPNIPKKQG